MLNALLKMFYNINKMSYLSRKHKNVNHILNG